MANDPEANNIIQTTIRINERDPDSPEGSVTAEEMCAAILTALDCEGFHIVRVQDA